MVLDGRAIGEINFTDDTGLLGAFLAASSIRLRHVGSAAMRASPFISYGAAALIWVWISVTSWTLSPITTPNRSWSNRQSFIHCSPAKRLYVFKPADLCRQDHKEIKGGMTWRSFAMLRCIPLSSFRGRPKVGARNP